MADEGNEARTPEGDEERRPGGIPAAESSARRRSDPGEDSDRKALRPPPPSPPAPSEPPSESADPKKPVGLKNLTPSARLRLQLALDHDDDDDDERPPGLSPMTTSARARLELALDHDEDEAIVAPRLPRISHPGAAAGRIPFDAEGRKVVRSLSRWVAFCGLLTLTVGALTGLSYLTGPGSVAHVVVGILASALSVWLLAAAWRFHRVNSDRRQQHHLVNALGLLRTALLLKAILLFSSMVLGCFTFSIAASLLFLL